MCDCVHLCVDIFNYKNMFLPHDVMLSAVYTVVMCLSVILYCIKTAKHRITKIMPHDSPGTLVFWCRSHGEIRTGSPPMGRQMQVGGLKLATFDGKRPITRAIPGLSCNIICIILRLAILIQYRSVTNKYTHRQTNRQTDTQRRHILH